MIISCSRRTDIPAFYSEWFFNRLREGFVEIRNPRNPRQTRTVSLLPEDVDGFVFWSRNPSPMLDKLHLLADYSYYFQYTLTPYGRELEPNLPPQPERVNTFRRLSDAISPHRVIWRYDPILFSQDIDFAFHEENFAMLARQLSGYTKRCVISFLDLYRHIEKRMKALAVQSPNEDEMRCLAETIAQISASFGMQVATCAEPIDLTVYGIEHSRCINDRLLSAISGRSISLPKDRHQRKACGCVTSVDIGAYNTCAHGCVYCYANAARKTIQINRLSHHPQSPLLIGRVGDR